MNNKYHLHFIRHGEHKGKLILPELTEKGVAEARAVGEHICKIIKDEKCYGMSVNEPRFIHTTTLALMPSLPIEQVCKVSERLSKTGGIVTDDKLDYRTMLHAGFKKDMLSAFNVGRAMRFIVDESDNYLEGYDALSTLGTMSEGIAELIRTTAQNTIFCARELVMPSFRSKMTEMRLGRTAMDDYADWYGSNEEWNPNARTHIVSIEINGSDYHLVDEYGSLDFNDKLLNKIGERK